MKRRDNPTAIIVGLVVYYVATLVGLGYASVWVLERLAT